MADNFLPLDDFLPYRLNRLAEAVGGAFSSIYKSRYGLTRPSWRLLATLGQYRSMTATEVGHHSSMHKTKVSRAVLDLEKRKWLVRSTDKLDRRTEHLMLTNTGLKVYAELVPFARNYEEQLLKELSPADKNTVLRGLALLEKATRLSTPRYRASP